MSPSVSTKIPAFIKHSGRVAWRKVAGEAVILDVETAAYFSLEGVGLRIWELLGEKKNVEQIVAALSEEYDEDEVVIRRDCEALLRRLLQEKIVEPA
jgi:hypothetical protein